MGDYSSIGDGLSRLFGCLGLVIFLLLGSLLILLITINKKEIVSDKLITPTIRLEVNNNQIDTLYIYKK